MLSWQGDETIIATKEAELEKLRLRVAELETAVHPATTTTADPAPEGHTIGAYIHNSRPCPGGSYHWCLHPQLQTLPRRVIPLVPTSTTADPAPEGHTIGAYIHNCRPCPGGSYHWCLHPQLQTLPRRVIPLVPTSTTADPAPEGHTIGAYIHNCSIDSDGTSGKSPAS